MIFEEATYKRINTFIKDTQEPVQYLILLFNVDSKQPYLGVIYQKDNVSKEELKDLLLYLYGVVVYDHSKINYYLDNNKNIPNLDTYIKDALSNHKSQSRVKLELEELFVNSLYKEDTSYILQKIQSIYKNNNAAINQAKEIRGAIKKLDVNFMEKGEKYDVNDIFIQQKKNLLDILRPFISNIIATSVDEALNLKIEDMIYSYFFKTADTLKEEESDREYCQYEEIENGIVRGSFKVHIKDKIASNNIELLHVVNDKYMNDIYKVLETEIFDILNNLSDSKKVKYLPTIEPFTIRTFNNIVNYIQYDNLYSHDYYVSDHLHEYGITHIYDNFHIRENRIELEINTNVNYAEKFRKYKSDWQDMNEALYSHLNEDFTSECFRRDILENSRMISYTIAEKYKTIEKYKIINKVRYLSEEREVNILYDVYKEDYDSDAIKHANLLGNIIHNDILSKSRVEELIQEFNELENKYRKVA